MVLRLKAWKSRSPPGPANPPHTYQPRTPSPRAQTHIPNNAGWSSPVARQAHNLKVTGSNPVPATTDNNDPDPPRPGSFFLVFPTFCRGRVQGRPCPNVAISEIAPLRARDILRLGVAEARNLVALDTLALNAAIGLIVNVMSGRGSIVPNLQSSAMLSVAATLVTLVLAIPAAYALARLRMPAKKPVGFYVLATQMLPPIGLVIPYFLIFSRFSLLNTYSGLIVVYVSFSLPFAIWMLISYFEDIPRELEEAALVDRASRLGALWHVILPQVRGGIAVAVVLVFLNAWNEFLFAVVLGGRTVRPVTVAMFNFISLEQTQWARVSAAALIARARVMLLGLLAQRHIVKGLTFGAVKGTARQ